MLGNFRVASRPISMSIVRTPSHCTALPQNRIVTLQTSRRLTAYKICRLPVMSLARYSKIPAGSLKAEELRFQATCRQHRG
jgi:hypothetical protein